MPYVTNQGIRIHYEVDGAGYPLVLHHGLSDGIQGWYEFGYVERLKDHFQLIMIDARGHGESDKPHAAADYMLDAFVYDVLTVLDKLKLWSVHYYGNSLGGRVGFGMAQHAASRCRSLALGGHHPYAANNQFFRDRLVDGMTDWVNTVEAMAGPLSAATRTRLSSNDAAALYALVQNDRPDISDVLPWMKMPVLLFAGTLDFNYTNTERAAAEIEHSLFVPMPDMNHFQAYTRGDLVIPILLDAVVDFFLRVEHEQTSVGI